MSNAHVKWKQFLAELDLASPQIFSRDRKYSPSTLPFTIYCDMDGVLVDLVQGIKDKIGDVINLESDEDKAALQTILHSGVEWEHAAKTDEEREVLKLVYRTLDHDPHFWASLPAMKGAQQLWSVIEPMGCMVLSSPWDEDSARGKRIWLSGLAQNLDPPIPQSRIIVTNDKAKFALNHEGISNVLIDDMERYLKGWSEAQQAAEQPVRAIKYDATMESPVQDVIDKLEAIIAEPDVDKS